jgi:hypothetical protein
MKFSEEFAGRYLKAADIKDLPSPVTATITHVEAEEVKSKSGSGLVHVLYTDKFEKGIIFKVTMGRVLAHAFGDDMDDWTGKPIELVVRDQEYGGETYEVIRFSIPRTKPVTMPKAAKA